MKNRTFYNRRRIFNLKRLDQNRKGESNNNKKDGGVKKKNSVPIKL